MNIDEHFDRVSKQNLKFQFEFVYCAPLGKLQCSSVVSRSCLCLFLDDVSVLFWCCDVLVTSRACFGEISVMCVDGAVMF